MFKWLKYITLGATVLSIVTDAMPKALEDERLTVGEITDMFSMAVGAAGFPVTLDLPPELADQTVAVIKHRDN